MKKSETTTLHDNAVILACFEVRDGVYALDVSCVREVVRWQEATPLPKAPSLIDGVIDLRGSVVPVIDLGRALCGDRTEPGNRTRIAVCEIEGLVVGLVVDAAVDVMSVDVTAMEDPPALAAQAGYDVTRAVVRRPDRAPLLVLSPEHVLESVYRSALDPLEEAS